MGSGREGGKGRNKNSEVGGSIPEEFKKMVQSLKEIVNCSEFEIFLMLKECNMDPNEAVHRLLSQDPFHEVKSKREKKKEAKESTDSRSHGTSSSSARGGRRGVDRYAGHSSMPQFGTSESGSSRANPTYKNDIVSTDYSSSFSPGKVGSNVYQQQLRFSDASATMDQKPWTTNVAEGTSSAHSSGFQSAWSGTHVQMSMADVVKMGRAYGRPASNSVSQQNADRHPMSVPSSAAVAHDWPPPEMNPEYGVVGRQHVPSDDEWPLDEQPPAQSTSSFMEPSADSEPYYESYGRTNQRYRFEDDVPFSDDGAADESHTDVVASVPGSSSNMQEEMSGGAPNFDSDYYHNMNSYQIQREVEDVSAAVSLVTTNLQRLTLPEEDEESHSEPSAVSLRIPDHLRVRSANCSHLSFGTFGSGAGPFGSRPLQSNLEEAPAAADEPSSVGQSDTRNPEYYGDEHLRHASDGYVAHRIDVSTRIYDSPSGLQSDELKQEAEDVTQATEYPFPSSKSNYTFENEQQLGTSLMHSQISSQIQSLQSLPPSSSEYPSSASTKLLASNVPSLREPEPSYSPFTVAQSTPLMFSCTVSSIPANSVSETLESDNFSSSPPPQTPTGTTNISEGTALPQHPLHQYSQPSLPLGHYANMMGYPFLPQSYTYMPSAFQQAFAGHQGLGVPQYKSGVSVGGLPQSAAAVSGYGGYGSSSGNPGGFGLNPPPAAGTSMGYDDVLSSQYRDPNHMLSLLQGPGSRPMPAMPGSAYYNQAGGFRQNQQHSAPPPPQHYGSLSGYPHPYYSQAGLSPDHQLQVSRDPSQRQQPSERSQQRWQDDY